MQKDKKIKLGLMTYAVDGRMAKGTAVVARHAIDELLKRKDEFELVFIHYEKSDDEIYRHGVREILLPKINIKFLNFLNSRFLRQLFWYIFNQERFDVIQWFQPRMYPFFWLAKGDNLICWIHGAGDLGVENTRTFEPSRSMFNWSLKSFNDKLKLAFAGSSFAKNDVVEKYGFQDPNKVVLVHYGADPLFFPRLEQEVERVRQKYDLPEKFLLNVARLNPGKNAFRVIRAFHKFASENPDQDICFVNVGNKGSEEEEVKEFINKSKFKDRIKLVGYVETLDLPAFYSACHALVFPLLNEGFGLPPIEALMCGTPVVVSDTCYPELTNESAILVDALSEESIAQGMKKVVSDTELRDKIIKNGVEEAKKYTWERMGERLVEIYKGLV